VRVVLFYAQVHKIALIARCIVLEKRAIINNQTAFVEDCTALVGKTMPVLVLFEK
jgi:hypothetical protein